MARRPAKDQGDTLKIITDAAFGLFARYGYDGVSVDQIAKASSLSKGAMYWHFKNKDDLFIACLNRLHELFNRYVFRAVLEAPTSAEGLKAFFDGLSIMMEDEMVKQGIAGYWLEPGRADRARIQAVLEDFELTSTTLLSETLDEGRDAGVFSFDPSADELARGLFGNAQGVLLAMRKQDADQNQRNLQLLRETVTRAYVK
jgi:TetR/AcrR family acrAB operon transcriptional repressor